MVAHRTTPTVAWQTVDTQPDLRQWLAGLERVERRLYERDADAWAEFSKYRRNLQDWISDLDYEGDISLDQPTRAAAEWLQQNDSARLEELERLLMAARALIGHELFDRQFRGAGT
jgi:hypothetical protein